VLQQSPVRPKAQYERLLTIDQTWGQWLTQSKTTCVVAVLSLCPIPGTNGFQATITDNNNNNHNNNITFKHLQVLFLSESQSNCNHTMHQQDPPSAYRNLAETMLTLIFQFPQTEYFTFANDHSFFILPFYDQFISMNLNQSQALLYTGNHFSIERGGVRVHFASGGAGITVSRDILHLMNLMWTLQGSASTVSQYLNHVLAYLTFKYHKHTHSDSSSHDRMDETTADSILEKESRMIMSADTYPRIAKFFKYCSLNDSLYLTLPRYSSLQIRCQTPRRKTLLRYTSIMTDEPQQEIEFDRMKSESYCLALDKWSKDNPGIEHNNVDPFLRVSIRDKTSIFKFQDRRVSRFETTTKCHRSRETHM
jgi:hypothetical protein